MEVLILIVFAFLAMWVFVVVPQRRRMAMHSRLVEGLQVGDEVLTAGGLFGDVTEIGEEEVALEIAPGVEVRVAARAIASVIPPDTYVDEDDDAAADGEAEAEPADAGAAAEPTPAETPASTEPGRR